MIRRAFVSAVAVGTFFSETHAQPAVAIADSPSWAEQLQIEDFTTDRADQFQLGVAYLLSDHQIRKTADGYDYVRRMAY